MTARKVIAYYAHEYEEAVVRQNLIGPSSVTTESYLIGDADDAAIATMRTRGVIVEEVAIPQEVPIEPMALGFGGPVPREAFSGHFKITFFVPLTEDVRAAVEATGARLLRDVSTRARTKMPERPEPRVYTALLNSRQYDAIRSLPTVASVQLFSDSDTGPAFAAVAPPIAKAVAPDTTSYEVRPQRREDLATLLAWLSARNVQHERRGRAVQITVPAGSPVLGQLEKLEIAPDVQPMEPLFDIRLHGPEKRDQLVDWLESQDVRVIGIARTKLRIRLDGDQAATLYESIRSHDLVSSIDSYSPPYVDNDLARVLLGVDVNNGVTIAPNISFTGAGEIIGVADTGIDVAHPDLQGRLLKAIGRGRPGNPSDPHGHGTHVSGSVCGDGTASNGSIRGVAPGAQLVVQSLLDANGRLGGLPLDLNDLFDEAYQLGVRIHNNSWGAAFGSEYAAHSEEVDEFVYDHPDMLVVIAAGNEGTAANSVNAVAGFVDLFSVGVPATAKNALTIGASRHARTTYGYSQLDYGAAWAADFPHPPISTEKVSGNPECIAAFSSRGPSTDHRMKPELVAPGTDILSTKSKIAPDRRFWGVLAGNNAYGYLGGTSMATPLVTGCAALVREYYRTKHNHTPSAALLKATLVNGGRWLTGADAIADHPRCPNYHQGFGFLSMPDVIPADENPWFELLFWDGWKDPNAEFVATGQRRQFNVDLQKSGPLRICLTWTDPPARSVQNKLHVILEDLASHTKWTGNENRPSLLKSLDHDNNVQVIRVENAPAGLYMVQVFNTVLLRRPQAFALVVTRPV